MTRFTARFRRDLIAWTDDLGLVGLKFLTGFLLTFLPLGALPLVLMEIVR